jgi:hypothetical protein
MAEGDDAWTAAVVAGYTRLRPVLMTAGAMVLGMIPMSLGVGEGGEQNAPLARAVIGGLLFATLATLIFVPAMYRLLRGWAADSAPFKEGMIMARPAVAGGGRGVGPHEPHGTASGNLTGGRSSSDRNESR